MRSKIGFVPAAVLALALGGAGAPALAQEPAARQVVVNGVAFQGNTTYSAADGSSNAWYWYKCSGKHTNSRPNL